MMNSPHEMGAVVAEAPSGFLRLGTWNVSHWTAAKAQLIAAEVGVDVLAIQETHLAAFLWSVHMGQHNVWGYSSTMDILCQQ